MLLGVPILEHFRVGVLSGEASLPFSLLPPFQNGSAVDAIALEQPPKTLMKFYEYYKVKEMTFLHKEQILFSLSQMMYQLGNILLFDRHGIKCI